MGKIFARAEAIVKNESINVCLDEASKKGFVGLSIGDVYTSEGAYEELYGRVEQYGDARVHLSVDDAFYLGSMLIAWASHQREMLDETE